MATTNLTGAWGEALAAAYLQKKKYTLLAAGFRCKFGEIDLIVKDKRHIVFVEVKLRKSDDFAKTREYVHRRKQDRIRVTAAIYLETHPSPLQPRFDVIEIYAPQGRETPSPEIIHLEDAFQ
jgi:putative endonuclease